MKTNHTILRSFFLMVLLAASGFWLGGCKKETAGITTDVAFNFYMGSDVLWAAYAPSRYTTAIYVDTFIAQKGPVNYDANLPFPNFVYGYSTREYPQLVNQGQVLYSRFLSGSHRLRFTDATNNVVIDTTIQPGNASTYTCFYLMDAAINADPKAVFKVLAVPEERTSAPAGQTGVRFVHLSPDAGELRVTVTGKDGATVGTLPVTLQYGNATAYQYLDSTNVSGGVLHLLLTTAGKGNSVSTGIAFQPGARYTIVVTGFVMPQQRQVAMRKLADGTIRYEQVEIPANLRTTIRKMY